MIAKLLPRSLIGRVYALKPDGALRWELDTGGPVDSSPALDATTVYIVGGPDGDARILADVYHLFRGGSGFESLKMLKGSIIDLFHMNDYPGSIPREKQTDSDRVYPGDGVAPIKEILQILADLSAQGLSLEGIKRVLALQAEVAQLRRIVAEFRREQQSTALVVWRPGQRK